MSSIELGRQQCYGNCGPSAQAGSAVLGFFLDYYTDHGYGCLFDVRGMRCIAGNFCSGGAPPRLCPAGSYCEAGASAPVPCPRGTYGATQGLVNASCSGVCTLCDSGATAFISNSRSQSPSASSTRKPIASMIHWLWVTEFYCCNLFQALYRRLRLNLARQQRHRRRPRLPERCVIGVAWVVHSCPTSIPSPTLLLISAPARPLPCWEGLHQARQL